MVSRRWGCFRTLSFVLVILDLYIPRVSSRTVLQRYRERGVPVVVFTCGANELEKCHALEHGAFGEAVLRMVERGVPAASVG